MSTKTVVEKLGLKGYKRTSKAKNGNTEYRLFIRDEDDYILTKESPNEIKKISTQGYLCFEHDNILYQKINNQIFDSFDEAVAFVCKVLKENEEFFLESALNDITERAYFEMKLGECLSSLKCFLDPKLLDTESVESGNYIEGSLVPKKYSENIDTACFSACLSWNKESKEIRFEITTD